MRGVRDQELVVREKEGGCSLTPNYWLLTTKKKEEKK